jgi:gliding motility-associated-like protein
VVKFYALPKTTTLSKRFCGLTDGKLAIPVDFDTLAYDIKWLTALNKQLNPTDSNRVLRVDSSDFPLVTEKHFHYLLKNDAGCTMKDSVIVKDLCDISVYVPTGFTPNGDGMNDSFKVFGMEKYLKNFQLYVFNRWGEVIYKTSDFYNAWDGNYREDQMPVGVYPYLITYELKDPELTGERKQNGKVTIVR